MLLLSLTYVVQKILQHAHIFFFGLLYVWTQVITQTRYPSSQCHNGIIQVLRLGIMIMFELCHHRENRALFVREASGMSMSSCQVFSVPASSIAEPAPAAEGTEPAVPKVRCAGTDGAARAHDTTVRSLCRPLGNVCTTCLIPEPLYIRPTDAPASLLYGPV